MKRKLNRSINVQFVAAGGLHVFNRAGGVNRPESRVNVQAQRDFIDRRQLVSALRALRRGDFTVRLPEAVDGIDGEIASLFNEVVGLNERITEEFERLSKVVGKEGKISQRARVRGASGGWDSKLRAVNELIDDMVQPTAEVARVIGAVAKGDLSQIDDGRRSTAGRCAANSCASARS